MSPHRSYPQLSSEIQNHLDPLLGQRLSEGLLSPPCLLACLLRPLCPSGLEILVFFQLMSHSPSTRSNGNKPQILTPFFRPNGVWSFWEEVGKTDDRVGGWVLKGWGGGLTPKHLPEHSWLVICTQSTLYFLAKSKAAGSLWGVACCGAGSDFPFAVWSWHVIQLVWHSL